MRYGAWVRSARCRAQARLLEPCHPASSPSRRAAVKRHSCPIPHSPCPESDPRKAQHRKLGPRPSSLGPILKPLECPMPFLAFAFLLAALTLPTSPALTDLGT